MRDQSAREARGIALAVMGSFFVAGEERRLEGLEPGERVLVPGNAAVRVDPNGTYPVGQMYVQHALPSVTRTRTPLVFLHGGSLTGAMWETTPDGREGWYVYFLRRGWECFNADAVERGRSGWAPSDARYAAKPILRTMQDCFHQFRIGSPVSATDLDSLERAAHPGCRFPLDRFAAFARQVVPRWTTTDALAVSACEALFARLDRPAVVAHSQGAVRAFEAASRRPGSVAAIVAVEPSSIGALDPDTLGAVPVLVVYGDHFDRDRRWEAIRARDEARLLRARANGASIEILDLPRSGHLGNSHLPMMERNSAVVAAIVEAWLLRRVGGAPAEVGGRGSTRPGPRDGHHGGP